MNEIGAIQQGLQLGIREAATYIMVVQMICTLAVILAILIFRGHE